MSELAGELKVVKKMSLADCFAAARGRRAMNETYKSHDITATAWQVLETKQWKPTILIFGPGVGSFRQERYIFDLLFPDEATAESAAIEWAKRLIDERLS